MSADVLGELRERARQLGRRIVLPEADDPRVVRAAAKLADAGLCKPVLLRRPGMELPPANVEVIDHERDDRLDTFAKQLVELRKHKGLTLPQAEARVRDPLTFAAFLVRSGDCAGAVAGSLAATADVIRAGLQVIGLAEGTKTVSSCFLMLLPDGRALTYADCGVVPDPTAEQLADIAQASADTHVRLVGDTPKVALLSFSTKGSARHPHVDKVIAAGDELTRRRP
ncbi:MAG: phosphate acyltransferase, partial [Planctomycetota bacterium]